MKEDENILKILNSTKKAFQNNNSSELKYLSNQTINTASLTQDADNIAAAVIVYSLSKIIERQDYRTLPGWNNFYKKIILFLGRKTVKSNLNSKLNEV